MTNIKTGYLNFVDKAKLNSKVEIKWDIFKDPIKVKEDLGSNEINNNLFPILVTGVRFWPYLLTARDFKDINSPDKIKTLLRKIKRKQPRSNYGPASLRRLKLYASMYNRIMKNDNCLKLQSFLSDGRLKYNGESNIFFKYEVKWKRLIKTSMGEPSMQYAKVLDKAKNGNIKLFGKGTETEIAISYILKNYKKYNELLWKGCFCYTLLRCLYGLKEKSGDEEDDTVDVQKSSQHDNWIILLKKILNSNSDMIPDNWYFYKQYLKPDPPFMDVTKQLEDRKRVLSGFKLYLFSNLYVNPSPSGI